MGEGIKNILTCCGHNICECLISYSSSSLSSSFIRLAQTMSHKFRLPHPIERGGGTARFCSTRSVTVTDRKGASEIALLVLRLGTSWDILILAQYRARGGHLFVPRIQNRSSRLLLGDWIGCRTGNGGKLINSWPDLALLDCCCLVSLHFLCNILTQWPSIHSIFAWWLYHYISGKLFNSSVTQKLTYQRGIFPCPLEQKAGPSLPVSYSMTLTDPPPLSR